MKNAKIPTMNDNTSPITMLFDMFVLSWKFPVWAYDSSFGFNKSIWNAQNMCAVVIVIKTIVIIITLVFGIVVVSHKIMAVAIIAINANEKFIVNFAQVMLDVLLGAVLSSPNSLPSLVIAVALIVFDAVRSISPITILIAIVSVLPKLVVFIADKNWFTRYKANGNDIMKIKLLVNWWTFLKFNNSSRLIKVKKIFFVTLFFPSRFFFDEYSKVWLTIEKYPIVMAIVKSVSPKSSEMIMTKFTNKLVEDMISTIL